MAGLGRTLPPIGLNVDFGNRGHDLNHYRSDATGRTCMNAGSLQ